MGDYRMDSTGLHNTGVERQSDLHFERSAGVDYATYNVDYALLRSLNLACNGVEVAEGADLDQRLSVAAKAAIDAELTSQNEPTEPWQILVKKSKPDAGFWDPQTNNRFIHVMYVPSGTTTEHVAVAKPSGEQDAAASKAYGEGQADTTTETWFVSDIITLEPTELS